MPQLIREGLLGPETVFEIVFILFYMVLCCSYPSEAIHNALYRLSTSFFFLLRSAGFSHKPLAQRPEPWRLLLSRSSLRSLELFH